jgi:phosphoglycolate phosphatase-like HAD superfamily hydrolase
MKLFVWDFHGVLEEGNEGAVLEISNYVLEDAGFSERFTSDDISMLYGRKWYEYFEHLLPGEPSELHDSLQASCLSYQDNTDIIRNHVKPTAHSHLVLSSIEDADHEQVLISNCTPGSLEFFVDCVGIRKFFSPGRIIAVSSHSKGCAGTKKEALEKYLDGKVYSGIVTIGDSAGDMELASVSGGVSYLYAHPSKEFRMCNSDYKIRDLREILKEI